LVVNTLSTERIHKLGKGLGFAAIGATQAFLGQAVRDHLERWIQQGYQADMGWMTAQLQTRTDLRHTFPWAKSVLVVADNYYSNRAESFSGARISRYAWGKDYHQVLNAKLERLIAALKKDYPGLRAKAYVDTGPVLEKAFAVQAGLGWQGKHSNVIVPGVGSYCFLGVVILNVPAEHSGRVANRCADCRQCLDACPTNALVAPGVVDARRCRSYLTIEKRGAFTSRQKQWLAPWLYGCDICQQVCPWNQKWATVARDRQYYDRVLLLQRTPGEWQSLTREHFKQLFRDSVFKRLKYSGLQRNLAALTAKSDRIDNR